MRVFLNGLSSVDMTILTHLQNIKPSLKFHAQREFSVFILAGYLLLVVFMLVTEKNAIAEEDLWSFHHTVQTHWQDYNGTASRSSAVNAGYFISADYLDTANLSFGYNSTFVNLGRDSSVTENTFYLSGLYHSYPDWLPGKLSLRFDVYSASELLKYRDTNPPKFWQRQTTDIVVSHPQLSFINYQKTFSADIGYAFSEYNSTIDTQATQLTPGIGFGWNDSFDWLRLRAFYINLSGDTSAFADVEFKSLEAKYTHWYADDINSNREFIRFTMLFGERALAVDADAAAIYSILAKQRQSISGSVQWKLSKNLKALALIQYDQYHDAIQVDDYDSVLFYINIQYMH